MPGSLTRPRVLLMFLAALATIATIAPFVSSGDGAPADDAEPGARAPSLAESRVAQPDVPRSDVTRSGVTRSNVTRSDVTRSGVTRSNVTRSGVTRSEASQRADLPEPVSAAPGLAEVLRASGFDGVLLLRDGRDGRLRASDPAAVDIGRVPASTFKIVSALAALETGVVADADTVIAWDGVVRERTSINRDLTLRDAFRLSALPHFQQLVRRMGPSRMQAFVDALDYGNRDLGGAADRFWISGDLRITPRQQIDLLDRLLADALPAAPAHQAILREIMHVESESESGSGPGAVEVFGKTGWASPAEGPDTGWWVGWIEHDGVRSVFATCLVATGPDPQRFLDARLDTTRAGLRALGLMPSS